MSAGHISNRRPDLQKIAEFVAEQPRAAVDISQRFGIPRGSIGRVISELVAARLAVVIGRARHAKRRDIYKDSPIYAKPGTPWLPGAGQARAPLRREQRIKKTPRNNAGSGVIAGGKYVAPQKRMEPHLAAAFERAALALAGPR